MPSGVPAEREKRVDRRCRILDPAWLQRASFVAIVCSNILALEFVDGALNSTSHYFRPSCQNVLNTAILEVLFKLNTILKEPFVVGHWFS